MIIHIPAKQKVMTLINKHDENVVCSTTVGMISSTATLFVPDNLQGACCFDEPSVVEEDVAVVVAVVHLNYNLDQGT